MHIYTNSILCTVHVIYTHIYTHIYLSYAHLPIPIPICSYTHMYTHLYTYTPLYIHLPIPIPICSYTHIYTCLYTYTPLYIHLSVYTPIYTGLEEHHEGVIDIITREAVYFKGEKGTIIEKAHIPLHLIDQVETKRRELIEQLADIDEHIAEQFINEETSSINDIINAIRRQTILRTFVPVFMGSAYKNKGVQLLLDGVSKYLPSPGEVDNNALDLSNDEAIVTLKSDPKAPLVALAFKLEESKFGQLTYVRVYQGKLSKGMYITNTNSKKKVKVPRLVRMHSNEMADVDSVEAGDVVAVFGVECASMDTFTDGSVDYSLTSMFVPNPVMSLAIKPKESAMMGQVCGCISVD